MDQAAAAITYSTRFGDGWVAFEGDTIVELGLPRSPLSYPESHTAPPHVTALAAALEEYWKGGPLPAASPDMMRSAARTPLTDEIYQRVAAIPGGTTMTYGEVAASLNRPRAARAVGAAMAANRFAPIIPCHRLIGADGALRGYAAGLDVKRYLLDMEAERTRA